MLKKILASLCAVCILTGALSGCSGENTTAPELTETASEAPQTDNTEESSPTEMTEKNEEITITFSHGAGFYDNEINLEIFCSDPDAQIRYTTDGSEPQLTDELYAGPLHLKDRSTEGNLLSSVTGISAGSNYTPKKRVKKGNVIRAAAFLPDGTVSKIFSSTYFIGIDRQAEYGDLPVISLFTDTANLFNKQTGIYVLGQTYEDWKAEHAGEHYEDWQAVGNYSNRGMEWERPVTCQYLPADGSEGFVQDLGMRIMGAASRSAAQKSLKLIAREEYGSKNIKYELLPDNLHSDGEGNVLKYKSFILRNGGNDCDFGKVRDPLFQLLSENRRFETQQAAPCIVFIDGEFWGLYSLTEDYSDNYFENNYGIEKENVVILKRGEIEDGNDEDIELYNEMYDFIMSSDMSVKENYDKASEMLDMGSFMDYCALNLYINNEDSIFKDNSWRMWRVRDADGKTSVSDGKWRMIVYDIDYSAGIYNSGNANVNNISEAFRELKSNVEGEDNPRKPGNLLSALYKNSEFRCGFINALCDMRNTDFEANSSVDALIELYGKYSTAVPATFERFGPDWVAQQDTAEYFEMRIAELANFLDGRYRKFPDIMKKALDLSDPVEVTVAAPENGGGTVMINSTFLDASADFKGKYFPDCPITVTAVPSEGKSFVKWECEGCTVSDKSSPEAEITLSGSCTIKAVFE